MFNAFSWDCMVKELPKRIDPNISDIFIQITQGNSMHSVKTRGQLFMMVGIPASGKSSWIRTNCDQTWTIISPDSILEERYDYEWTPERAAEAWAEAFQQYGQVLLNGGKVVWDATFVSPIVRAGVLHIGNGAGFNTQAMFFDTDVELCVQRNLERDREPVPEETIRRMHESLVPPTEAEGFDKVVRIA